MSQQDSNDNPKVQSAGSDKESMDRFTDPPESSDCSNHSTTDKDSEVSDSDTRHGAGSVRNEAAALAQPAVRPRPGPAPYQQQPAAANSGPAGGVLAPSRLGNPFARVAPPVVRSSPDSSEQRGGGGGGGGVLAPSRLGGGGAAVVSSSRSVLRPSALSVPAASLKTPETNGLASSTFTLHPPKFNNPFAAKPAPEEDSEGGSVAPECASTEPAGGRRPAAATAAAAAGPATHETVTSTSGSNGFTFQTAAAPDRRPEETASPSISSSSSGGGGGGGGFVFGQNLQERVTNAAPEPAAAVSSTFDERPSDGATGEPTAAQAQGTPPSGLSLRESAAVYEKQRSSKRKYDEVEVVTGEEDESNVLQINCKLYAFNKDNCSWLERGRGLLRLNDRMEEGGPLHSRLVFRTQGSLRLVLNTKIWPGMSVEKPSEKDVRVTAMDNDQVKVFLIKSSSKDAELLFNALDYRLSGLKASDEAAAAKKARPQEEAGTQD